MALAVSRRVTKLRLEPPSKNRASAAGGEPSSPGRCVLLLPVVFALAACDMSLGNLTGRATDEWTRRYPLSPGGEVRVVNTNGKIEVEPADGTDVEIRAERVARAATDSGARELLPRITIKEDVSPDRVFVQTERMSGIMIGAAFEVRYHVRVPKSAVVNVANTNGQIALTGLGGKVMARTTNGAVTGRGLTGGVEARSTNGMVNIDFASIGPDRISARTTNGGVVVALPDSAKADVSASWTNGGINVAPDLKLEVIERSRRRFEGRMNGGGTSIELQTTNGGIRLRPRTTAEAEDSKSEKGL
jgi:Putative adhesin